MRLLLDTHAFLWFINGDDKLSQRSRALIQEYNNEVLVSIATLWEIAIKISLNKLELLQPFEIIIPKELADNEFTLLAIKLEYLVELRKLPFYHRDPFDRLLIAQSLSEKLPLISKDDQFDNYGVERTW